MFHSTYTYVASENTRLFTVILRPAASGKFPVVIIRSPYVDQFEKLPEPEIVSAYEQEYRAWLENGYAIVLQHCRGRGKSEGDCIAYINERTDGLCLQDWIRKQDFYNGELYLKGQSYLASVHYVTAPFAEDIKGAIFAVQDYERYNICYRNGCMKRALHGNWYVGMYKAKQHMEKHFTPDTFDMLPLCDFTKTVFGECAQDFDFMLKAPLPTDAFWQTLQGGADARGATDHVQFPVLFTTGFYDIYTGGVFDMWNKMNETSRKRCALVVSPYDHGDSCNPDDGIVFAQGKRTERFGDKYEIEWINAIRNKTKPPFATGQVTYYRLFENQWACDSFAPARETMEIRLGEEKKSYVYNPYDAPRFKGGLSRAFGGAAFQDAPNSRHDILSVYTPPFDENVFVKGKMQLQLCVASDCEDTCFYVRVSIEMPQGDFGLRDDITSLGFALGDYTPNSEVMLHFECDEHAFFIKAGQRLRVDIASADNAHYVRHTNQKGLYSEQTTAKIARNTVDLTKSSLILPVEG